MMLLDNKKCSPVIIKREEYKEMDLNDYLLNCHIFVIFVLNSVHETI